MYKFLLLLFSFLGFCLPTLSFSVDFLSAAGHLPKGTSLGFIAKNLTRNQIIVEKNADTFMLPASTQKVFTALAATLFLGDQFRYQTALFTQGNIKNGVLNGDLIIKFSGDPDLTRDQLYQLLVKLKQQNITQILGNLVLDTSVFIGHDRGLGWVWNDLPLCFNAPPAAINIDNNCFYVELDADYPEGELARFNVPTYYPVQVFGQVNIVSKAQSAHCRLDAIVHDNNRYQIKGCLARQKKPFGLSFAVQDPDAYGATIILRDLKRINIAFNGQVQLRPTPQNAKLIAEHFSPPLPVLVKKMMKKSDNQIADSLFRTIAFHYFKRPASFQSGALAMQYILQKRAGIRFENSNIADGSGLSRHNLITPHSLLQALEFIARNDRQLHLIDTFPVAGVDGTLSGRGSMLTPPLIKNLTAKTGALKGVYNLAGFLTNKTGETVAFVQFINGYSTGNYEAKTKRAFLNQFEHRIYNAIYAD